MGNIIIVKLDSTYATVYSGIWQWNYGQILRIQGGNLPKVVEVHFSLQDKGGDSITRIGTTIDGATDVPIPDSFLENGGRAQDYKICAFIYLEDGTAGNTEYKIEMSVKSRPKPEVPGTPEEPELFRETVKAVNAAADRAEQSEQKAKASAIEAGKYAASASKSTVAAEKIKEDALKEVGEKKREAIEAIQEQEETSVGKIVNHTDNEIQRIQNQTADSKAGLEQTIKNAGVSKEELKHSIETAGTSKTALNKSTELAGTAKTELDTSIREAGTAKNALDESTETAGTVHETLSATVKQAGALDVSLDEKIKTGTQLKTDLTASGEKAVQGIQTAGSEQLGKMQAVAEEFTADREQITTNKEDISSLKEEMGKNFLDDAKTKRSLDALWKLNQGISYQFETDDTEAYQKTIPSGAKLASVKKIGGRTIVWNQLVAKQAKSKHNYGLDFVWLDNGKIKISGTSTYAGGDSNVYMILKGIEAIGNHKYLLKLTGTDRFCILGYGVGDNTPQAQKLIFNAPDSGTENIAIHGIEEKIQSGTVIDDVVCPQIFDLTKIFGAGNEPSTPEEFEAMFQADYYPYNAGKLMSAPVNEVVEHGKNYFDFSKLVSDGVNVMNYEKQTITIPAKMNNTGYNQTLRDLCPGITPGTYVFSTKRSNPESSDGSYFLEAMKDFSTNTPIELTDELLDNHIAWYNNQDSEIENVISEIQIEKNSVKTSYSQYYQKSHKIPQTILNLDGYGDGVSADVYNYVDWENKQYHKRVGRVDLGSLTWNAGGKYGDYFRYNAPNFLIPSLDSIGNTLCAKFNRASVGTEVEGYGFHGIELYLIIQTAKYSTNTEFAQAMQGVMLYYELDEEQIIDISDIIDNTFQEPIEVEAGGTLTFHNSNGDGYRIPVPNEEEYIVSLAEVGGGASE